MSQGLAMSRVIVFVGDVLKQIAFYQTHFGGELVGEPSAEWGELRLGGCCLAFHQAYIGGKTFTGPTGSGDHPHKIVFYVADADMDAERERLLAAGVPMRKISRFEWDGRTIALCDGADPEGHPFQLSSR